MRREGTPSPYDSQWFQVHWRRGALAGQFFHSSKGARELTNLFCPRDVSGNTQSEGCFCSRTNSFTPSLVRAEPKFQLCGACVGREAYCKSSERVARPVTSAL